MRSAELVRGVRRAYQQCEIPMQGQESQLTLIGRGQLPALSRAWLHSVQLSSLLAALVVSVLMCHHTPRDGLRLGVQAATAAAESAQAAVSSMRAEASAAVRTAEAKQAEAQQDMLEMLETLKQQQQLLEAQRAQQEAKQAALEAQRGPRARSPGQR